MGPTSPPGARRRRNARKSTAANQLKPRTGSAFAAPTPPNPEAIPIPPPPRTPSPSRAAKSRRRQGPSRRQGPPSPTGANSPSAAAFRLRSRKSCDYLRIAEPLPLDPQTVCALTAVGKRHRFRGPWAIQDATLTLHSGTIVEVAGPDGAGKSTLLNLIAGSTDATTGKVERTHEGSEYEPQHLPSGLLLTGLTYLRNMAGEGRTRDAANARVQALAIGLDLERALQLPLAHLPKDTGHRVALARALANPTQLVVLDDPWSGLDEHSRLFLVGELAERRAAGACVVVTAESDPPAELPVDERYLVRDGIVTPTTLAAKPA